jgi:hypothetical protein
MTTTEFPSDLPLASAFGPIYARRLVSSHDLLASVSSNAAVQEFLSPYDLTKQVVRRGVLDLDAEPGVNQVWLSTSKAGRATDVSDAAAAALARCQERESVTGAGVLRSPVDLLLALLDDPTCTAVDYLTGCGVNVAELQEAARSGRAAIHEDPLPPALRSARDALVGRRRYQPRELDRFWVSLLVRVLPSFNCGVQPALWARLEAGDLAEQHGGPVRSDDVLLALLSTYAVAQAYPHLVTGAVEDFAAAQALVAAGVDHERVRAVMADADLGQDAVPVRRLLKDSPSDTSALLARLLAEPDNRSTRLLAGLGITPMDLVVGS